MADFFRRGWGLPFVCGIIVAALKTFLDGMQMQPQYIVPGSGWRRLCESRHEKNHDQDISWPEDKK